MTAKERPILFSAPMVRGLLDGSKTQTRRAAKLTDGGHVKEPRGHRRWHPGDPNATQACPHGQPGDRLWVREAFRTTSRHDPIKPSSLPANLRPGKYRPGMFMPRAASRITLEITSVRVERLQDISEADALAEGIKINVDSTGRPMVRISGKCPPVAYIKDNSLAAAEYASLWDTINGPGSWAANPWVWAIDFKVLPK
jgi:hypothetical protein